jgi:hypothetical protein
MNFGMSVDELLEEGGALSKKTSYIFPDGSRFLRSERRGEKYAPRHSAGRFLAESDTF